jgi:hypothetical protein
MLYRSAGLKSDRLLEPCKAKTGEEAECTFVHEHSELVFNAAGPTRSRSSADDVNVARRFVQEVLRQAAEQGL